MTDQDHKLTIYQLLPRLFGNKATVNNFYGSVEENGVGKFNDITDKALISLKEMGISHVWYTGVIEHATMTDHSDYGIANDDPDVVKGRAGSPYAIKDYYDVAPDLAEDVPNRMNEFQDLVIRTHLNGLKVIIDFVPNHVARTYASDAKPEGVRDFGEDDDTSKAFSPANDFYYIPGEHFTVPAGYIPGGDNFIDPKKDAQFDEYPAKATGNDVFSATPSINDWFETVKLNYGVDYLDGRKTYFSPVPPLWLKMYDILGYWVEKGVDGFRCDMIEMVPVEFWAWLITKLKTVYPELIFIGEAYDKDQYENYIHRGGFDYLYDKVGLYDAIRRLTCNQPGSSTWEINAVINHHCQGIENNMLRFMENHDEQRIASRFFSHNAQAAKAGMIISATLNTGPVMIYSGQEVGEPAVGECGFSGDDGRTTIFDYWGVPEHQKWMNGGEFNGGGLSTEQNELRVFYSKLLNAVHDSAALRAGEFYELMMANEHQPGFDTKLYIYMRYAGDERVLVLANFDDGDREFTITLPDDLLSRLNLTGAVTGSDVLSGAMFTTDDIGGGIAVSIKRMSGLLLNLQ